MKAYLLIDFGSTNTKITAVDTTNRRILGTAKAMTTVESDIKTGYLQALSALEAKIGKIEYYKKIACSSAAGGLKMAAIGLVEELTVEAAKRACYGAGGKVDLVFSFFLQERDIEEIKAKKIDIILLAGGTDGGNTESVLANAKMLASAKLNIPIIYAGNRACQDEVTRIFDAYNEKIIMINNIMPRLNVLQIEEAKEKIRQIFLKNIIAAKGIKQIESEIDEVIFPTPHAVLLAATLLAKGYLEEEGLGDIVLVDIGGATTDVYSIASGAPTRADVVLKGLEEPFAKRTVEGDLGVRYSVQGIVDSLSEEEKLAYLAQGFDLQKEAMRRRKDVAFLPQNEQDSQVDQLFAAICADRAMSRHVGKMESVYTPLGMMYYQYGKDLSAVKAIIGTGGVVINDSEPNKILQVMIQNRKTGLQLRPKNPKIMVDEAYILSAMGLLSLDEPVAALKIMKENIKEKSE